MRPTAVVNVVLVCLLASACASEAADSTSSTTSTTACPARVDLVDEPYVGGGDPLQALDLYQPPDAGCEPVPLVVWVHGGGWTIGDKANGMRSKVPLWHDAGWAVASLNYRLTDLTDPDGERLLAPAHNEDVAAAVGWLVEHATELGIDPSRLALLGHSAGAGIAAALASDPTYLGAVGLEPDDLTCVAALDTEGFDIELVVDGGAPTQTNLYQLVFGEDRRRWDELSPVTHLGEAAVPDLFLVRRGEPGRRAQVDAFAEAAEAADATVTVVDLPGFTHPDVSGRIGDPADDVLTPALQAFLTGCLTGSGP